MAGHFFGNRRVIAAIGITNTAIACQSAPAQVRELVAVARRKTQATRLLWFLGISSSICFMFLVVPGRFLNCDNHWVGRGARGLQAVRRVLWFATIKGSGPRTSWTCILEREFFCIRGATV